MVRILSLSSYEGDIGISKKRNAIVGIMHNRLFLESCPNKITLFV